MAGELGAALDALVVKLAAALPGRTVSRDFQPLSARSQAQLLAGVVSVVLASESAPKNNLAAGFSFGWKRLVVVAQFELAGAVSPLAVEQAELALRDALLPALALAPFPAGMQAVRVLEVRYSGQLEAPFGWVAVEAEFFSG